MVAGETRTAKSLSPVQKPTVEQTPEKEEPMRVPSAIKASITAVAADAADAAADAAAARCKMLQQCADEVRKFYPKAPTIKKTT